MDRLLGACLLGFVLSGMHFGAAMAACTAIATPADLNKIRANLAGQFCLTKDIDMSGVANFVPIGDVAHPFTNPFRGMLDGQGHVIKNLKIVTGFESGGLFITFGRAGVIQNLGLVNVNVVGTSASPRIGAVVGEMLGPVPGSPANVEKIIGVYVTGSVRANDSALIGGLVGNKNGGLISRSYSKAAVTANRYNSIGGIVGVQSFGTISESHSTGPVTSSDGNVGGLVGNNQNEGALVERSYATGPVNEKGNSGGSYVGGLIGKNDAPVRDSYATGAVQADGKYDHVGGLIGNNAAKGALARVFAAGRVTASPSSSAGGLIGFNVAAAAPRKAVTAAFWDTSTSGQSISAVGTPVGSGQTTAQLQAALPAGFTGAVWGITPNVSYPYLISAGVNFRSALATTVFNNQLYTFLPIGQRDKFEYGGAASGAGFASKAAVFTILARAIGTTRAVAAMSAAKIDTNFWVDATKQTYWRGPITTYATLGPLATIPAAQPIGANLIGVLRSDRVVALRGSFRNTAGAQAVHWLLATSFVTASNGVVTEIVANDPWTGQQVRINRNTKAVTTPANFPLAQFKVDAFQVVTLK